jgi:hypothetical protein
MFRRRWQAMSRNLPTAILIVTTVLLEASASSADGLPPGQHSAHPKYWPQISKSVINFTPLQFDLAIRNLTPGPSRDLWFSVGSSIEHIDADNKTTSITLPYPQWRVSGIALLQDSVVFTAGQSGKIGIITPGAVRYIQIVPRQDFPDLRDLIVNDRGEMWFIDAGRRSIGYRSASGRVVEHPFPDNAFPVRLRHCMGKLWVVAINAFKGGALYVIDEDLKPQPYLPIVPKPNQASDIACDRMDRLWVVSYYGASTLTVRFDAHGNLKQYDGIGGNISPDPTDGIWTWANRSTGGVTLLHVAADSAKRSYALPIPYYLASDIAIAPDRTIWLAINAAGSPVAVTKLYSRR